MDCFGDIIKGFWSFIFDFVRFILFALCLLFALSRIVYFWFLGISANVGLRVPWPGLRDIMPLQGLLLFVFALFGCWAVFYRRFRAMMLVSSILSDS